MYNTNTSNFDRGYDWSRMHTVLWAKKYSSARFTFESYLMASSFPTFHKDLQGGQGTTQYHVLGHLGSIIEAIDEIDGNLQKFLKLNLRSILVLGCWGKKSHVASWSVGVSRDGGPSKSSRDIYLQGCVYVYIYIHIYIWIYTYICVDNIYIYYVYQYPRLK